MKIIKHIGFGISMGCTVFVMGCLIGYWIAGDFFLEVVMSNYTQQVIGSVVVGLGCILPTHIYKIDRLTFLQQSLCHFFIAIVIFIVTAFLLKWIPIFSIKLTLLLLLFSVFLFAVVWLLFYLHAQSEVKKMKKKIFEQSANCDRQ